MLTAEHVRVRYGEKTAVKDLSFTLREGQWLMLIGPNGAGKSSLIRAIGQAAAYEGRLLLRGRDLRGMKSAERAREIGILAQHNAMEYAYTVEEIVRLGRYAHRQGFLGRDGAGDAAVEEALRRTGMTELRGERMTALSGGEVQRAFLAQVFAQQPSLMVLDEPANHLDLNYQLQIFSLIGEWLREPGRAVISVVHDLSLARRWGTEALLLDRGRCAALGRAAEVFRPEMLAQVYGMDVSAWMREQAALWQ